MTNLDLVHEAIEELERQEITFAVASRLADLYIIRDHMEGVQIPAKVTEVISVDETDSEFMRAVKEAGTEKAWAIMDELMSTLQTINYRLYESVILQLTS